MLDRDKLVTAINKICADTYKEYSVSELVPKGGYRHRIEIEADGSSFFLDFHFRANGSTSIDISSGHHLDKKKHIMAALLNDASLLLPKPAISN